MIKFVDEETKLTFIKFNNNELKNQEEIFNQINSWSYADNIRQYITNNKKVNDFFIDLNNKTDNNPCGLYYTFENSQPVGVMFLNDVNYTESIIEYIVVNPQMQGKGIATRMIKSITNNLKFFTGHPNTESLIATIDKSNIASQKAFLKNNFYQLQPAYSSQLNQSNFSHFRYLKPNQNSKEM